MSDTYTFTINIEAKGTPYTNTSTGETKPSVAGHMWFSISNGVDKPINSGFALENGFLIGDGHVVDDDDSAYAGDPAYSRTITITKEQYVEIEKYIKNNEANKPFYNVLTNSCIDYTWGALGLIMDTGGFEGNLYPEFNSLYIDLLIENPTLFKQLSELTDFAQNPGLYFGNKFVELLSNFGNFDTDTQYDALFGDNFPTFRIFDTQVRENDGKAVVYVVLNRAFDKEVVINLFYQSGTAKYSHDYKYTQHSIAIEPNSLFGYVEIPIMDDNRKEYDEIFTVRATIANYQDFAEPENLELNGSHYNQIATITILDDDKNDFLYGRNINSELHGENKNETLIGTSGNDLICGNGGDDYIMSGDGDDVIFSDSMPYVTFDITTGRITIHTDTRYDGNDTIYGEAGNDIIFGGYENDITYGGNGDDEIHSDFGDDILYGGDGNDRLNGDGDNDTLIGGDGDDYLDGGSGNDTYIFNKGDGNDTIVEWGGDDILKFGSGISKNNLIISRSGKYLTDILIKFKNSPNDSITLKNVILNDKTSLNNIIENFIFANGEKLGFDDIKAMSLIGSDENDIIIGYSNQDNIIIGNKGDDIIYGHNANDTLQGGLGDDTIYGEAGDDEIYGQDGNDYLYGDTGEDKIYGNLGNDMLIGGAGDDILEGGYGSDTYIFNLGDGNDIIYDRYGNDTVKFGFGISKDDLIVSRSGKYLTDILIKFKNSTNDSITLKNVISNNKTNLNNAIENFVFSNGETLKFDDIKTLCLNPLSNNSNDIITGFDDMNNNISSLGGADEIYGGNLDDMLHGGWGNDEIYGNAGDDEIHGGMGFDILYGGSGDDTIYGESGNDTLIGGSGNDELIGGNGNDIYIFNKDDGKDTIYESGGIDSIKFGSNLNADDIKFNQILDDLVIKYSPNDQITITDYFTDGKIENFELEDGSILTSDQINKIIQDFHALNTQNNSEFDGFSFADIQNNSNLQVYG